MINIAVIIGAIFADNLLLTKLFGIESFFSTSEKRSSSLAYGGFVTLITVVAGTICVIVGKTVFFSLSLDFLTTFASVVIIMSVMCAFHIIARAISQKMYGAFTKYMPLISTNCVVLGSVYICIDNNFSIAMSMLYLLAAGIGFTVSLLIFNSIQERLESVNCPSSFKGMPILLLCAFFAAMAFSGFAGLFA